MSPYKKEKCPSCGSENFSWLHEGSHLLTCLNCKAEWVGTNQPRETTLWDMSLRDYFAAKAMQAELVANNEAELSKIASWAYAAADAMIAERSK